MIDELPLTEQNLRRGIHEFEAYTGLRITEITVPKGIWDKFIEDTIPLARRYQVNGSLSDIGENPIESFQFCGWPIKVITE